MNSKLTGKRGALKKRTSAECARRVSSPGKFWGILPREILKTRTSQMPFLATCALILHIFNKNCE